jgi:hypothetical protein
MFKQKTKAFHGTFQYLCEKNGFTFEKTTPMRNAISVEDNAVMSLMCLGSGNGLQIMGDFFEITKSIISFQ